MPSDEVKAAIERAGRRSFHLWGQCAPAEVWLFLSLIAKEPAVCEMMAKETNFRAGMADISNALKALAKECGE